MSDHEGDYNARGRDQTPGVDRARGDFSPPKFAFTEWPDLQGNLATISVTNATNASDGEIALFNSRVAQSCVTHPQVRSKGTPQTQFVLSDNQRNEPSGPASVPIAPRSTRGKPKAYRARRPPRACYGCGSFEHLARSCPHIAPANNVIQGLYSRDGYAISDPTGAPGDQTLRTVVADAEPSDECFQLKEKSIEEGQKTTKHRQLFSEHATADIGPDLIEFSDEDKAEEKGEWEGGEGGEDGEEMVTLTLRRKRKAMKSKPATFDLTPFLHYGINGLGN